MYSEFINGIKQEEIDFPKRFASYEKRSTAFFSIWLTTKTPMTETMLAFILTKLLI